MAKTNVILFPTKYREKKRFISNSGSRMMPTYMMEVDHEGKRELKKQKGGINLYAKIQSYKDSCDINYLLARFARGDESALSKVQGIYGDFTQMPKTFAELSQRVIDAENLFNNLPLATRKEFNFSASEFYASIGTEKFDSLFKDNTKNPAQPEASPVGEVIDMQTQPVVNTQKGEIVNE